MKNKIWIVGMGPGNEEMMTGRAIEVLEQVDVIIGYTVYLDLLGERFQDKEFLSTPMRQEEKRCRMAFKEVMKGKDTAMICSGDAGVYGMSGLIYEISQDYPGVDIEIVSRVTAALSGGAVLGAPLMHDFAVISLSDLMTPWELIQKRLAAAASADMAICLYNPSSKKRKDYLNKACQIVMQYASPATVCGIVRQIGRDGEFFEVMTLQQLAEYEADMFTTVFIGNSNSSIVNGKLLTKRGYQIERNTDICRNN